MIKPHLCCDADLSKLKLPLMGLPKIDGCRGLHITGSMTGRSLKPHGNLHVTAKYSNKFCEGLDGEFTFGDIHGDSLCRDTTSVMSRIQGTPDVQWNIFDYVIPETANTPYIERYEIAKCLVEDIPVSGLVMVPYTMLYSVEEVEAMYEWCLNEGYEGLILRDPQGVAKSGRATVKEGAYLRMKAQSDKEAIVLRLVEALENQNEAKVGLLGRTERSSHKENKVGKGMVGMLVCRDLETGMEIDVGAGKLTHEERTFYWNNPDDMVGQYVKYRSMDSGVKDKPRFARYICKRAESDMS